ncbi:MAG: TA system VapC family ribonuclease toxin [Chloroflexota bacterium]
MILVDANLLLYAYDSTSPSHEVAKAWLEATLSGDEEVRIPLTSALAFIRIGSNPVVFRQPMSVATAVGIVAEWLDRPGVSLALPAAGHWTRLAKVATEGQARGPLVTDAHLAVLAQEHGAVLCTTDRDFARFAGLRINNPLTS